VLVATPVNEDPPIVRATVLAENVAVMTAPDASPVVA
jgi:hypothetical protein